MHDLRCPCPQSDRVIERCFDRMATVAKDKIALSVLQTARADAAAGKHKSAIQNCRRALAMGGPSAGFAEEAAQELAKVEAVAIRPVLREMPFTSRCP